MPSFNRDLNFQRRLAARYDCASIEEPKHRKLCQALKLLRRFEKDLQKVGSELQDNLEKIKANEAPLVQKFFAGDGPLIVLLNMLAEISKLTPESAEVIGIESMLRPEYDRIEKLSSQITDKRKELAHTEMGLQTKTRMYGENYKKMQKLLTDQRELGHIQEEIKSKFRDLRHVFEEMEVINNGIINAATQNEDLSGRLMKVDRIIEELLDVEKELENLQVKASEKSDIIESILESLILEEQTDE